MKNILVVILIIALILISFLLLLKLNFYYQRIEKMKGEQLKRDIKYLENLSNAVEMINKLQEDNDKLEVAYELLNTDKDTDVWHEFVITAYTSNECGTLTSIGIDLKSGYAKYLSIAAVDPKVVPYGSILLIKFNDGSVKPYLAADCGGFIKGNRIDIYMTEVEKALEFGRQKLPVKIINRISN